jgi:hypothetical protein
VSGLTDQLQADAADILLSEDDFAEWVSYSQAGVVKEVLASFVRDMTALEDTGDGDEAVSRATAVIDTSAAGIPSPVLADTVVVRTPAGASETWEVVSVGGHNDDGLATLELIRVSGRRIGRSMRRSR